MDGGDGLEYGVHRLDALVPMGATGAGSGLFVCFARQHAEADGDTGFDRQPHQVLGHGVVDVSVMGRFAAYDAAKSDDGVRSPRSTIHAAVAAEHGKFEGTGGGDVDDRGWITACVDKCLLGTVTQDIGDVRVVSTGDDGDGEIACVRSDFIVWMWLHGRRSGSLMVQGRPRVLQWPGLRWDRTMRDMLGRLLTTLQLTRMSIAFGAVNDLWFTIVLVWMLSTWTPASGPTIWWSDPTMLQGVLVLAAGLVTAVGLFGCGAALNDVLDARHDAAFSPDRPIPAGLIRPGQAVVIAVTALMIAVVAAAVLGPWSVWLTLFTASLVLFYNAAARFVPAVGIVTLGIIHAVHMLIPYPELPILLPVWWSMSHAMVIAVGIHVLESKRPRLTGRAMLGIVIGWLFWSGMLLLLAFDRGIGIWPESLPLINLLWPAAALVIFVLFARWKLASALDWSSGAEKLKRYGSMWHAVYAAAWLLALGMPWPAACFGVLAVTGLVVMTVLRELLGLSGRPVQYR